MKSVLNSINQFWDQHILPTLCDYISIPNKSPHFDLDWKENGHMDQAMQLIYQWCQTHKIDGMTCKIIESDGRTPLLFIDIPGDIEQTVLLYGHMDKQPEMTGWDEGLSPWKPVIKDGKLYGRGGADDGYACFAAMGAIKALVAHQRSHGRCILLIEGSEESGSMDLPYYIETLKDQIPEPDLVICLDSGAGNYEQLWSTTSLRGVMSGILHIQTLKEGVHSGLASGVTPTVFQILQDCLRRLENPHTGEILCQALHAKIPAARIEEANAAALTLGSALIEAYPLCRDVTILTDDPTQQLLNRTWRPALAVTGIDGIPSLQQAGNVALPKLSCMLSFRLPPTIDPADAQSAIQSLLEMQPLHHAGIRYEPRESNKGWNAPALCDWLKAANEDASMNIFGRPAAYFGEGGSIPFMGMLGEKFPNAQFLITGVLGPKSNAHGPNEFLHIDYAKKVTACVASILHAHYKHAKKLSS